MSPEEGSDPTPTRERVSAKNAKLLMLGLAGAILLLIVVAAIVAVVLWRLGFFTSTVGLVLPLQETNLILHVQDKNLNVIEAKSLVTAPPQDVQKGEGYLIIRDSERLRITGAITVSAWFNARSFDKAMAVAGRAQNEAPWRYPFVSWLIRINTVSVIEADVGDGRNYSPSGFVVPELVPGQWHHVAMTYDGATKRLFLNGVASGSQGYAGGIGNTAGRPILIGADESEAPAGDIFDGSIDDIRLFDTALPESDIQSLFQEGARRYRINR
jgi:hypothetical protein